MMNNTMKQNIPQKVGNRAAQAWWASEKVKLSVWSSFLLGCSWGLSSDVFCGTFLSPLEVISYASSAHLQSTKSLFKLLLFYVKCRFIILWRITWFWDFLPTVEAFVWRSSSLSAAAWGSRPGHCDLTDPRVQFTTGKLLWWTSYRSIFRLVF